MFEYYGYSSDIPRALDFSAAGDLRYEAEQGVYGLHSEIAADTDRTSTWYRGTQANVWDNNAMYFWVLSQLMWDPHQDVLALRREFLTRAYGAAADDVADYLSCVENAWNRALNGSFYSSNGDNAWYVLGRLGLIPRCREALARARKHNLPQKSRTLVERLAASFEKSEMILNFDRCNEFSRKQMEHPENFRNLILNGSFEEASNEKPANGMADWNATGLKDWSVWRRLNIGEYGVAKGAGVNGSTCIYIGSETTPKETTGEIVGGKPDRKRETVVFLQSPELTWGASYVIRLKTRVDNVRDGRPHLAIRWRNAKNDGWELHHDLSFLAEPRVPGEWTTIEGFFTVPKDTAGISLQIGSTDTIGRVYFDNVELYKVVAQSS